MNNKNNDYEQYWLCTPVGASGKLINDAPGYINSETGELNPIKEFTKEMLTKEVLGNYGDLSAGCINLEDNFRIIIYKFNNTIYTNAYCFNLKLDESLLLFYTKCDLGDKNRTYELARFRETKLWKRIILVKDVRCIKVSKNILRKYI